MSQLFCIVIILFAAQLPQNFGFVANLYSAAGCIGCYKSMSIDYFTSLSTIFSDCATKETADFDAIGRRAYFFMNACKGNYFSGSQFEERYPELQKRGSSVLLAYQKCSGKKELDADNKADLEIFNDEFLKDRTECGDETYLEIEQKFFRDLLTSPPSSGQNTPPTQNQEKPAAGPASPKDASSKPEDSKTPPSTPTQVNTTSKDSTDTSKGSNPPPTDTSQSNTSSKDSNNTSKDSTPPPSKDTTNSAQGKDTPPPPATPPQNSASTKDSATISPNPTQINTSPPKDPNSPSPTNDPAKTSQGTNSSTENAVQNTSSKVAATTTQGGDNSPPPDNTLNKSQGNNPTSHKPADQITPPSADPSKSTQTNTQTADLSSLLTSSVDPGALVNSFLGFNGSSSTSPNNQQSLTSTSSVTQSNQISNNPSTMANGQETSSSTNPKTNTPSSASSTPLNGPPISTSTSGTPNDKNPPPASNYGYVLGGGSPNWF